MKICVITGTRAEYGLLQNLMKKVKLDKKLKLQLIVTGMHLSKKFGNTYKDILKDGFKINKKVDIKSMARNVYMQDHYVHNFVAYQKDMPSDILLFISINKKSGVVQICGWSSFGPNLLVEKNSFGDLLRYTNTLELIKKSSFLYCFYSCFSLFLLSPS